MSSSWQQTSHRVACSLPGGGRLEKRHKMESRVSQNPQKEGRRKSLYFRMILKINCICVGLAKEIETTMTHRPRWRTWRDDFCGQLKMHGK